MKQILLFLSLVFAQSALVAQVKTAGINYSVGAPAWTPSVNTGSELAIDTVSKRIYLWNRNTGAWDIQGQGIDNTSGGTPPAYTPGQTDSKFAINNANPPELYAWTGSAWAKVSGGGGTTYTAGTGIAISMSNVISNTAPDQTVSISGGGINTVTGTYPSFTVTGNEVDGSTTNEIQTIDTFSIVGQTLSISLSSDNVSLRQVTLPASGITALTGDVTATGPGSVAATIAAGAVTNTKLGTGSVDSVKVAALSVSDVHIKTVAPSKILQAGATAGQVLAWNGTSNIWAPATVSGGSGWALTGNAATAGSSFLGTTNLVSLRFRTNNVQRVNFDSLGNVGININLPLARLHVLGNASSTSTYTAQFHNATGTNNSLTIRDDGSIGIGTAAPADRLTITGGNVQIDNGRRYRWVDGSYVESGGTSSLSTFRSLGNFLFQGANVYVGLTGATPAAKFHIIGAGATSATNVLRLQNSTPVDLLNIRNDGQISFWATNTATGTTGARTIDRPSGTVNFAAGASTLVVTNALVTTSSIVFAVVRTNDTTATIKNVVPAAGSFTITLTANATAETSVGFFVIN